MHDSRMMYCWTTGSSQLMAELGCSKWAWPPDEITKQRHWTHLSNIMLLSCTLRSWGPVKSGRPARNSGVLKAGGPPGLSFNLEYSQQLGDVAAYPTIPEAQTLKSFSKLLSSRRSSAKCNRMSKRNRSPFNAWTALESGGWMPQQISRKIRQPYWETAWTAWDAGTSRLWGIVKSTSLGNFGLDCCETDAWTTSVGACLTDETSCDASAWPVGSKMGSSSETLLACVESDKMSELAAVCNTCQWGVFSCANAPWGLPHAPSPTG